MYDPNRIISQQQDPEERRAIRHEYRELLQEADGKYCEYLNNIVKLIKMYQYMEVCFKSSQKEILRLKGLNYNKVRIKALN